MQLTISELADAGDVGVETIRYYQRKGLLRDPGRRAGIRKYEAADVERLRFIRLAQQAGFALAEIGELLALDAGHDRERARELAEGKIAALTGQIATLERVRTSLRRLARQCRAEAGGPCPILKSFAEPAGPKARRARRR